MDSGTWESETWDSETWDAGTRGLGDVGVGDVGRGTRNAGTRGLGDVGLGEVGFGDAWRHGDVMNKPDFCAEFVKYNFRWSCILLAVVYEEQRAFWRDEKNNSDERDTRLKRLSSYNN